MFELRQPPRRVPATGADDQRDHVLGRGIGMTAGGATSVEQARHAFLLNALPPLVSSLRTDPKHAAGKGLIWRGRGARSTRSTARSP
jgi:hypothetical protein